MDGHAIGSPGVGLAGWLVLVACSAAAERLSHCQALEVLFSRSARGSGRDVGVDKVALQRRKSGQVACNRVVNAECVAVFAEERK
jgi:hypothetical protein